jgi:hypothetical protein
MDRRLATYGVAAGAVLAGGAAAHAGVHYTTGDLTVGAGNPSQEIDLNGDSTGDLLLTHSSFSNSMSSQQTGDAAGQNGANVLASTSWARNLSAGGLIGPAAGPTWAANADLFRHVRTSGWTSTTSGSLTNTTTSYTSGNFLPASPGYLGLRFDPNGGSDWLYAWVHIDDVAEDFSTFHVDGWAYEDSGGAIQAGDEGTASVPEPSALALLATGAAGVLATRRRRKDRASAEA